MCPCFKLPPFTFPHSCSYSGIFGRSPVLAERSLNSFAGHSELSVVQPGKGVCGQSSSFISFCKPFGALSSFPSLTLCPTSMPCPCGYFHLKGPTSIFTFQNLIHIPREHQVLSKALGLADENGGRVSCPGRAYKGSR